MTFQQELKSWMSPTAPSAAIATPPAMGSKAPSTTKLPIPNSNKPVIVAFLRHCGCPFAEKTFKALRYSAEANPSISHIALSHSSPESTEKWLTEVGGAGKVQIINDEAREVYAQWGLGTSSTWHVLSPSALWNAVKLGREEGIWNRETSSGNRWQTAGAWAVNREGKVVWGGVEGQAGESAANGFEEAVKALEK